MKKLVLVALCLIILLSMIGCDKKGPDGNKDSNPPMGGNIDRPNEGPSMNEESSEYETESIETGPVSSPELDETDIINN